MNNKKEEEFNKIMRKITEIIKTSCVLQTGEIHKVVLIGRFCDWFRKENPDFDEKKFRKEVLN